ncbi:hypothetical protein C2845_PM13G08430 [Panicum miliaceum]|uniref:Uncharacterized protein n=1 Tax=Panicum miliaceum TaxID=4540 RepID=A0A3L6RIQ9_PANMI|nr:hypothetical protein C2845_PM13G08430 [Panicum miliaceum]
MSAESNSRSMENEDLEVVGAHRQNAISGDELKRQQAVGDEDDERSPVGPGAEEFDFDPEEGLEDAMPCWFEEMGAAWRLDDPIPVHSLGKNRFILEFKVEEV